MDEEQLENTINETKEHIRYVQQFITKFNNEMLNRAMIHDQSKLQSPEIECFAFNGGKLKTCTYGSEEYKGFLNDLQPALKHHYKYNSHHPEHYPNGIDDMDLFDVVEMFCDWKAATLRHADGDMMKSIDINTKRFNMSEQLASIFRNTLKYFNTTQD